jgi:hypothetical protein
LPVSSNLFAIKAKSIVRWMRAHGPRHKNRKKTTGCYMYIFTAPTCTTIIITLKRCALNAEFQHFMFNKQWYFNKFSLLCRYHWNVKSSLLPFWVVLNTPFSFQIALRFSTFNRMKLLNLPYVPHHLITSQTVSIPELIPNKWDSIISYHSVSTEGPTDYKSPKRKN